MAQLRRDRARNLVLTEVEGCEFGHDAILGRNGALEYGGKEGLVRMVVEARGNSSGKAVWHSMQIISQGQWPMKAASRWWHIGRHTRIGAKRRRGAGLAGLAGLRGVGRGWSGDIHRIAMIIQRNGSCVICGGW